MYDIIEKKGHSTIQHGKANDRIYLMKLDKQDYPQIIEKINILAQKNDYSKIFTKIPEWAVDGFRKDSYIQEASIPGFYDGEVDTYFYSKFIDDQRAVLDNKEQELIKKHIELAKSRQGSSINSIQNAGFTPRRLTADDIPRLANLYRKVFKSYPFPIFEHFYLKQTMDDHIIYFGVFDEEKLIAASSAEMDHKASNAEMTDFATDPAHAGNNLSLILLHEMESEMQRKKIRTLYTIARSYSAGMNITFAKLDYQYSGTLVNNTNIFGKIQSMNVWYKLLS